jgi:thiol-disulfide isomerase/thioredoxin
MLTQKFNNYLEISKNAFNGMLRDKKSVLLVIILIIIFSVVFYFVYNNYIKNNIIKNHSLNKEFVGKSKDTSNDVVILFFYTEWCPYCKQALPELTKFENHIAIQNSKNDYTITLKKIDCDKNSTLADKYKIEGYPTIKLLYKKEIYNYDAKPDKTSLIKFLETSIA